MVVLAAGAYAYSASQPKQYAATSEVHITSPNADEVFAGAQIKTDPKREVDTQTLIAKSTQIRTCANKALGSSASQVDKISVSGTGDTDILLIRAASHSAKVAQKASIAVTDCYLASRHQSTIKQYQGQIAALQKQSAALAKKIAALNAPLAPRDRPQRSAASSPTCRARRTRSTRAPTRRPSTRRWALVTWS